jgi:hypothetical protein
VSLLVTDEQKKELREAWMQDTEGSCSYEEWLEAIVQHLLSELAFYREQPGEHDRGRQ